jgi:hypothetical protein
MKKFWAIILFPIILLLIFFKTKKGGDKNEKAVNDSVNRNANGIEDRVFDPQIYIYNNDPSGWCATVNNDYLRGVVTVFEAADLIPAKTPKIPFYESKEFGFVVGVLSTAVLIYLIK